MMTRTIFFVVGSAMVWGMGPGAAHAEGAPPGEHGKQAQYFADQAYAAFQREDWPRAIAMYMESFKIVATPDLLYNVAVIYDRKLGDTALALEFYRRHNASSDTNYDLVAKSAKRIAELSKPAQTIVAPTPDQPTASKRIETARPEDNPRAAYHVSGIVVGVVGLAGVGLGIGFGVEAAKEASAAHAAGCTANGCYDAASKTMDGNAFRDGTIATVGIVAGSALTLLGVTLFLLAPSSKSKTLAGFQLTPAIGPGSIGLNLSGELF